jgi:hypothetical protein
MDFPIPILIIIPVMVIIWAVCLCYSIKNQREMRFTRQRLSNDRLVLAFNQANRNITQNLERKYHTDNAPPAYEPPPPYTQIDTNTNLSIPSVSSNVAY